jgi:predicted pyridoxine 5'-phosphate oxidase superfamily flavin-nucleotide-binding protein
MGITIKKAKINQGMKKMIEKNALGFATVDKKECPHNIAVAFVKVIDNNKLLISDNYLNETTKNIKENPNVALVVWNKNWMKNCVGYELAGNAEYFTKGIYLEMMKKIPENKGEPCKGAIVVTLNKIKVLA